MRRPLMDSDPVRTGAAGSATALVQITPDTAVAVARKALAAAAVDAAAVVEDGCPAGVVTLDALQAVADGATVADVMDYEVVRVPPGADGSAILAAFTRAGWASLLRRRPAPEREGRAAS